MTKPTRKLHTLVTLLIAKDMVGTTPKPLADWPTQGRLKSFLKEGTRNTTAVNTEGYKVLNEQIKRLPEDLYYYLVTAKHQEITSLVDKYNIKDLDIFLDAIYDDPKLFTD